MDDLTEQARRAAIACKGIDGYDPSSLLTKLADRIDDQSAELETAKLIGQNADKLLAIIEELEAENKHMKRELREWETDVR